MVKVLVLIDVTQPALSEETSPADVVLGVANVPKTGHLKRVNHTVIGVGAVRDLETWSFVWLQLVLCKLHDSRVILGQVPLFTEEWRVGEEDIWISGGERALDESNDLVGWTS